MYFSKVNNLGLGNDALKIGTGIDYNGKIISRKIIVRTKRRSYFLIHPRTWDHINHFCENLSQHLTENPDPKCSSSVSARLFSQRKHRVRFLGYLTHISYK